MKRGHGVYDTRTSGSILMLRAELIKLFCSMYSLCGSLDEFVPEKI